MDLRINDSRRYSQTMQSSASGSSTAIGVKNKWIKAFRSLKLTTVGSSNRNNDQSDVESQSRINVQLGVHAFSEYTYKKISACDVCREILRGHSRQGLKCKLCKMNVHAGMCQENAPKCQPKPRLLRKQKSASELETKITIPQIDDEKCQNYDPVYQSLRAAANARRCALYYQQQKLQHQRDLSESNGSISNSSNNQQQLSGSSLANQQQLADSTDSIGSNASLNNNNNNSNNNSSGSPGASACRKNTSSSCPAIMRPQLIMHRNSDSEFHTEYQQFILQHHQQHSQALQMAHSVRYQTQAAPFPRASLTHYNPNHNHNHNHNNNNNVNVNVNCESDIGRGTPSAGTGYYNVSSTTTATTTTTTAAAAGGKKQNSPALLSIVQFSNQTYSAPHSPQKKRLTLRMKSLSLDSPESAEQTLKEKQPYSSTKTRIPSGTFNSSAIGHVVMPQLGTVTPPALPPSIPPPILSLMHMNPSQSPDCEGFIQGPPLPSSRPPTVTVGQSPPRYDLEMLNNYSGFKVSAGMQAQQNYQISKRFKFGMHERTKSLERDDLQQQPILLQDFPPCSLSPCPSPKPQRLLPTNIFVVLYNFRSRQIDELNLKAGYLVTVVDTTDPDWWQGKCMGQVGYFPSKYVTKLFPGERPLQIIHTVQLTDGEFAIKLLREQIVIQVSEEISGIIMVRTGTNDKIVPCPSKYLQEILF